MAAMKTMMTCVIDAGQNMSQKLSVNSECSKLSLALGIVSSHITQRMLASKTVEFSVFAFGADDTYNYLNQSQEGEYEHIVEVVEMSKPTISTLQKLKEVKSGSNEGDLIDAIIVGVDSLLRNNINKKYNRIMLLVTDGETKLSGFSTTDGSDNSNIEDLNTVIDQMKANELILYVMVLANSNTVTSTRKENIKFYHSLVAGVGGGEVIEVDNTADALSRLSLGIGLGTRPMQRKITLEISPEFKVPAVFWSKYSKLKIPSLKKHVEVKPRLGLPSGSGSGRGEILTSEDDTRGVTIDRLYFNPADPDTLLYDQEKVKGYKYGPHYVPVTGADEAALKLPPSDPIVKLLGFLPAHRISRQHYIDSPHILQGPPSHPSVQSLIGALAIAMKESQQVALVRFVKTSSSDPWLAVLLPPEELDGTLLLHRLPCIEDVRDHGFPSLDDSRFVGTPTAEQRTLMSSLVNRLTVTPPPPTIYAPNLAFLSALAEIQRRATQATQDQVTYANHTPYTMLGNNPSVASMITAVKEKFPLVAATVVEGEEEGAEGRKRRSFWADLDLDFPAKKLEAESKLNVKEMKVPVKAEEAAPLHRLDLGSVAPVADFKAIIEKGNEAERSAAFAALGQIVEGLVTSGGTSAHIRKAIACLQAMRESALAEGEHRLFNTYLETVIKGKFGRSRHSLFWQAVSSSGVTPISTAEDSGSSYAPDEAAVFYDEDILITQQQTAPVEVQEEEDLFGNME